MTRILTVVIVLWAWAGIALAQEQAVWVQIEAQPNLAEATERARIYADALPDVNGFRMSSGWYAIALGPYARRDADQVLQVYRAEGVIPRDSFIAFSGSFRQQFWPVGANLLNRGVVAPPVAVPAAPDPEPETGAAPVAAIPPAPDETRAQALRSERDLSGEERQALQVALQWAGTYQGAIDGAYGRGTRAAMAAWQEQQGLPGTGVLTTAQRAALLRDYNAVLTDIGFAVVRDETAGIEIGLPMGAVAFEKYEYPFAHYNRSGDIEARVLLISQAGDQTTLFGLYDIMQTLEIVPLDGPRERGERSFTIKGTDGQIVSETRARLEDGQIKGFTLVWPAGDEARRTRLIDEMARTLVRLEGTISPEAGAEAQAIDLIAGLTVRKPRLSRSGFFVDSKGTAVTTQGAVAGCGRITLDDEIEADVVFEDAARGVAVLQPRTGVSPLAVARFSARAPRLASEVAASGYSYEGVLGAPSMTFGTLSDLQGLRGEPDLARLALTMLPGDAGGPVLDAGGGVLGMLLPAPETGRALPEGVSFALDREALQDVLAQAGLAAARTDSGVAIDPIDLTTAATGMTVLVSCWD
ncbi:MAG: serine protease [Pseudomonadota bacterium]